MTTLVVCLDRRGDVIGDGGPVVGHDAVERLVVAFGRTDPENSQVNCLLEGLRVADSLEADGESALVAVLSGGGDAVGPDRTIARQASELIDTHDIDSAVVVVDSAEDERIVPIVESRVPVDAVDRVVVRQARDIESTYYLLKQFLADEELRKTVLIPLGVVLVAFPVLWLLAESPLVATASIAAVIGVFLLYKGLGVDTYLSALPGQIRDAFYSGQVALVTYVVATGLGLVGVFAGAIGATARPDAGGFVQGLTFLYQGVPWLTVAALTASLGRLLDELIHDDDEIHAAYLNLPFGAIAVGLVVRGFSAYFLERAGSIRPARIPPLDLGPLLVEGVSLAAGTRLAAFIVAGVLVSLVGVQFTTYVTDRTVEESVLDQSRDS